MSDWTHSRVKVVIDLFNHGYTNVQIAEKLNRRFGTFFSANAVNGRLDREFDRDPSRFSRAKGHRLPTMGSSDKYDALPDSTILALLQARDDECLPATAPRYAMTSQKAHSVCRAIDIALAESEAA